MTAILELLTALIKYLDLLLYGAQAMGPKLWII